jgi:hypothetical protein
LEGDGDIVLAGFLGLVGLFDPALFSMLYSGLQLSLFGFSYRYYIDLKAIL